MIIIILISRCLILCCQHKHHFVEHVIPACYEQVALQNCSVQQYIVYSTQRHTYNTPLSKCERYIWDHKDTSYFVREGDRAKVWVCCEHIGKFECATLWWRNMSVMKSQIIHNSIICSTPCSDRQKKHQSCALLHFVRGIHRSSLEFPLQMASNAISVSIYWRHHGPYLPVRT